MRRLAARIHFGKNMRKIAFLLAAVAFAKFTDAAPITVGPWHTDESNGFKMQLPRKWQQVPTKFQDVVVVGKWTAKRRRKGMYAPEVHVLRFVKKKGAPEGASPADAAKRGIPGRSSMIRFQPKDIWQYVERRMWGNKEITEEIADFKLSRSKTQKAHLRVYQQKVNGDPRRAGQRAMLVVAAAIEEREDPDFSYGVVCFATVADIKDALRPVQDAHQAVSNPQGRR